jgi:hypothetical protein
VCNFAIVLGGGNDGCGSGSGIGRCHFRRYLALPYFPMPRRSATRLENSAEKGSPLPQSGFVTLSRSLAAPYGLKPAVMCYVFRKLAANSCQGLTLCRQPIF